MRVKILSEWKPFIPRICTVAKETLGEVRVILFGSTVYGEATAASDIDILVISESLPKTVRARARLKAALEEKAGLPPAHPIEIHLATLKEAQANPIYKEALEKGFQVNQGFI